MLPDGPSYRAPGQLTPQERADVDALLAAVSNDFVPPLRARSSTTQADLARISTAADASYAASLAQQANLLARTAGGQLIGLLSFAAPYRHPLFETRGECTYVSTVAVLREYRHQGVARDLYESLFAFSAASSRWILLRTWSGNTGHLRLLDTLGFEQLSRIADDRGAGVDTLYLARRQP